ncbi:MipA/OmpV family protein [Motilimonas pumila]|uniref:MipA/OmpV family protein n=1 Tax=Motilimonas pumila TaxID=2303987 RepID=A0A418YEG1_9GAMM|nr:MipA/OmpV family protein [Motilimonas pumila]RJG47540.1 MipA/OmpV family protein [Motilimonas pumila]
MKKTTLLSVLFGAMVSAQNVAWANATPAQEWGVGIGVRSASIAFDMPQDSVHDVIPLLFYQGERFYLDGFKGGLKYYQSDALTLDVLGRFRFFDIPRAKQNDYQAAQFDLGTGATWHLDKHSQVKLELMTDKDSRYYANASVSTRFAGEHWQLQPYATLRAKSARFNNAYYGLNQTDIGAALDYEVGVKGRYQVYQNLFAVGHVGATMLDNNTYRSPTIDSRVQWQSYAGLSLMSTTRTQGSGIAEGAYMRLAHGIATTSSVTDLIRLDNDTDPYRNSMTSVFYGHPLSEGVFGLPLDFYVTPGYVQHHSSNVQKAFGEYVVAIKAYYTLDLPVKTRLGFAEGISYSTKVSHIEQANMTEKGLKPSKLMNYLDFSIDVNVGDMVNKPALNNLWLGYSLHHRSGIFSSTSTFGRIKGGSDYNSLYLQWHF